MVGSSLWWGYLMPETCHPGIPVYPPLEPMETAQLMRYQPALLW